MGLELLPERIREKYEVHEWRHAISILKTDFPEQWDDLLFVIIVGSLECLYKVSPLSDPLPRKLQTHFDHIIFVS